MFPGDITARFSGIDNFVNRIRTGTHIAENRLYRLWRGTDEKEAPRIIKEALSPEGVRALAEEYERGRSFAHSKTIIPLQFNGDELVCEDYSGQPLRSFYPLHKEELSE